MRIEIQDLHFSYPGGVEALKGVSLVVNTGEKVAIVGQNGAGKTTLVKHLNGLLLPTKGTVRIGDWDTKDYPVARLSSRVGYVFQNPDEQLFNKTVYQEVAFGPRNLGYPAEKVAELVKNAMALTELTGKENVNPYDLMPTWRKMVAMASILAMDTPIVVLDEPTTGQDAASIERIAHCVQVLHQQGKTVITITHDVDFCAENFDRIIVMGGGRILLDGPAIEVLAQEEILATTYVEPPQLTRLGNRLDFPHPVRNEEEFLDMYRQLHRQRDRA